MKNKLKTFLPFLVLFGLILLIYYPVSGFEFLQWDDDYQIYQNPYFEKGEWLPFWQDSYMGLYIPIVYTVWSILYHLTSSPDPTVFHIFNLALHVLNSYLVFLLIRKILENQFRKHEKTWLAALAGAILFAIHPLQVGAVAWISGGRDLMSSFLALSALLLYYDRQTRKEYFFSLILFAISLFCKPGVVSFPLVFLLMDWVLKRRLWSAAPFFAMGLFLIPLTRYSQEFYMQGMSKQEWYFRPIIALDAVGFYLSKLFLPISLAVDYGRMPEKVINEQMFWPFLAIALVGILVAAWCLRYGQAVWVGGMIFISGLLPVLGLIPFNFQRMSTVTDHYMYLPIVGVSLILAFMLIQINRRWFLGLVSVLGVSLAVLSSQRLPVWRSFFPFFEDMLEKNPKSHSAYVNLGDRYFKLGNVLKAESLFRGGLKEHPMSGIAAEDLGYVLIYQGRYQEVIDTLKPYIDNSEYDAINMVHAHTIALTYSSYAGALWQLGHLDEALKRYCQALKYRPRPADYSKIMELLEMVRIKLREKDPTANLSCEPY